MMKSETLLPMDLELNILNQEGKHIQFQSEQIWLTKSQLEVLEIVARSINKTVSEYITNTILSMLKCDVDSGITWKLQEKLGHDYNESIEEEGV